MDLEYEDVSSAVEASDGGKKKKKKKKKEIAEINKNTVGILRTQLRNSIELTNLADSKANVLLSLSALMLTFLIPLTLPYLDRILLYNLQIPFLILVGTCLITIYISVTVLRPGKLGGQDIKTATSNKKLSPFFFGNFLNMSKDDFLDYSGEVFKDEALVTSFISNDFYYIGLRLGQKMSVLRKAFNIFMFGIALAIASAILFIIFNNQL